VIAGVIGLVLNVHGLAETRLARQPPHGLSGGRWPSLADDISPDDLPPEARASRDRTASARPS